MNLSMLVSELFHKAAFAGSVLSIFMYFSSLYHLRTLKTETKGERILHIQIPIVLILGFHIFQVFGSYDGSTSFTQKILSPSLSLTVFLVGYVLTFIIVDIIWWKKMANIVKFVRYKLDKKYAAKKDLLNVRVDFQEIKNRFQKDYADFKNYNLAVYREEVKQSPKRLQILRVHGYSEEYVNFNARKKLDSQTFKSAEGDEIKYAEILKLNENDTLEEDEYFTRVCELIQHTDSYLSISEHVLEDKNIQRFKILLDEILKIVWHEKEEVEEVARKVEELSDKKLDELLEKDLKLLSELS